MVMDWNKDEIANVDDLEHYILEHVLKVHEYNQYSPSIRYNTEQDKLVMKFRYGRGVVPGKIWKKVTDYLQEDYEILEEIGEVAREIKGILKEIYNISTYVMVIEEIYEIFKCIERYP